MGYDSRIYVVRPTEVSYLDEGTFAIVKAMFNLGKFDHFGHIFKRKSECYIYADDGIKKIIKDAYNEPLREATLDEVIEYLQSISSDIDMGSRARQVLAYLKVLKEECKDPVLILHYGD